MITSIQRAGSDWLAGKTIWETGEIQIARSFGSVRVSGEGERERNALDAYGARIEERDVQPFC